METKTYIEQYIQDKQLAWSQSTLKSERYRLLGLAESITGDAMVLWQALDAQKPYSRVTAWTRVTQFWDWLMETEKIPNGRNPYQIFRTKHERLFKNAYQERVPSIGFEEAVSRVSTITDRSVRDQAKRILLSGMRYFESRTYAGGQVVGKGGKVREVFLGDKGRQLELRSYATFRRALAEVGLKPHDLRKIYAARVVEEGANEFELKELMGWSKLDTAAKYIKAKRSRVQAIAGKIASGK